MNQELFDKFLDGSVFLATAYWYYTNKEKLEHLSLDELYKIAVTDISKTYLQKVFTFVRSLWDNSFDGLPDSVKRAVEFMEENPDLHDYAIRTELKTSSIVIMQAKAFLVMEEHGVFD